MIINIKNIVRISPIVLSIGITSIASVKFGSMLGFILGLCMYFIMDTIVEIITKLYI